MEATLDGTTLECSVVVAERSYDSTECCAFPCRGGDDAEWHTNILTRSAVLSVGNNEE